QGICCSSKSLWSSPLHVVAKSSGSKRPVGDYRRLNAVTTPDQYPIPHIQGFSNAMYNKSIFSKIDIRVYYHIPSNRKIEEWHRPMKAAFKAYNTEHWSDALSAILLGFRIAYKEDLQSSSTELVYGTTIRLLGEFSILRQWTRH
ncbi:integrase catalytic domain-containing protein, partial [Trichonephila clavipes]